MNLIYVPAEKADIEPLFQLSKDLIDRYENTSQIDYSKVLSWIQNKIEKYIGEYTCVFRGNQKVGYYRFHSAEGKIIWCIEHKESWYSTPAFDYLFFITDFIVYNNYVGPTNMCSRDLNNPWTKDNTKSRE